MVACQDYTPNCNPSSGVGHITVTLGVTTPLVSVSPALGNSLASYQLTHASGASQD